MDNETIKQVPSTSITFKLVEIKQNKVTDPIKTANGTPIRWSTEQLILDKVIKV